MANRAHATQSSTGCHTSSNRYDYSKAGTGQRKEPRQPETATQSGFPIPRVRVRLADGQEHEFTSAGLHEDVTFAVNDTTGELIVERVVYGPRGDDQWARLGSEVAAAWPVVGWQSATMLNPALAPVLGHRVVVQLPHDYRDMTREQKVDTWMGAFDPMQPL